MMMDDDGVIEDAGGGTYAAQLHRVFEGCDRSGTGLLGRTELIELCGKLHLQDQAGLVLGHLLAGDDPEAKLDFDEFKEKFVCLLTQSVNDQQADHDLVSDQCAVGDKDEAEPYVSQQEREVDPKYVWGSKKYGRRSRPDAVDSSSSSIDGSGTESDDLPSNSSSSDVFVPISATMMVPTPPVSSTCPSAISPALAGICDTVGAVSPVRQRASSSNGGKQMGAKRRRRMESHDENEGGGGGTVPQLSAGLHTYSKEDGLLSSEGSSETEEDYLRSIWLKLGVGTDGYLDLEGLTQVCEHIGMEKMSEEVVDQLFDKLDVDRDGRIHFDEFMHLFRAGEANHHQRQQQQRRSSTDTTTSSNPLGDHGQSPTAGGCSKLGDGGGSSDSTSNAGCNPGESGIFGSIDPHSTGYAEQEAMLELWDSLGITNGYGILKELGFHESSLICLLDLTHVLEDILQMSSGEPELTHAAFVCHTHELKFLRRTVHQLRLERDYLLVDVADANSRAMLIAQEVDENQAKLEQKSQENLANLSRKYQDQVRRLKEELECEQDTWNEQMVKLRAELQAEFSARQEADAVHRERLAELDKEVQEAIRDKQNLERRLAEAERRHQERQMEEEENFARPLEDERSDEGRCARLTFELEMMKAANKQLQDRNDELGVKVEKLKTQLSSKLSLECPSPPPPSSLLPEVTPNETKRVIPCTRQSTDAAMPIVVVPNVQVPSVGGGHRRSGSWLSDYVKAERGKPTAPTAGDDGEPFKVEADENPINLDWSEDSHDEEKDVEEDEEEEEEYRPFRPTCGVDHVKLHLKQGAVQKLEMNKVFSLLKRRFIENYLEELDRTVNDDPIQIEIEAESENSLADNLQRLRRQTQVVDVAVPSRNLGKLTSDSGFEDGHSGSNTTTPLSKILPHDECVTSESRLKHYGIEEEETEAENVIPPLASENENEIHFDQGDDKMDNLEHRWQTAIDSERQNWIQIMLNIESRCVDLQEKLESKDACLKTNLLKSEVFWRRQVELERVEMESDRAALENKIIQLQLQLDRVRKKVKKDEWKMLLTSSDDGKVDRGGDDVDVGGAPVSRSRSWRDPGCRREVTVRRCFSGRTTSTSSSSVTTSENEVLGFDADSLEEPAEINKKKKSGCPHRVPCCTKLDLCKWQLLKSEQRRQSVERDVQRIQLEFLTKGTTLERVRFDSSDDDRSNCVVDMEMLHAINQHVRQQEQRCRQLEASMATAQLQSNNELKEVRRTSDEELRRVTQLLTRTRALFKDQTTKLREQNEKLLQSDLLVKELYVENAQLFKNIQSLEEKQRVTECANFGLQHKVHTLNQLLAEVFRSPAPLSL